MKISTRISLLFSLLTSSILILFGITIYVFESQHQFIDFQDRLKKRIEITENFFLEKESFSTSEYEKIRSQFLQTLPKETEEVILISNGTIPTFNQTYSDELKEKLISKNAHSFNQGEIQGESKQFNIRGETFLIIVTAIDDIGTQNLLFLRNRTIILILLAIPLIFIFSFLITRRSLFPLSKKIEHANNIGASNLDQRLKVLNPNDEIGKLATAFNKLLDRLEISFSAQKSFISNASHEMRNPLTAIIGEAEVTLSKTRTPEEYKATLIAILEGADSLNSTMTNLLQLSKINANEEGVLFELVDIGEFIIITKKSYDYLNPLNKINLNIPNRNLIVKINKNLLKTAIINLFDNACKYSNNKEVDVNLEQFNKEVNISIIDKGIGIPENDLQKIKAPFYRANNTFEYTGSGIGLALSSKIIGIHQGDLIITSQENIGTQALVILPLI